MLFCWSYCFVIIAMIFSLRKITYLTVAAFLRARLLKSTAFADGVKRGLRHARQLC